MDLSEADDSPLAELKIADASRSASSSLSKIGDESDGACFSIVFGTILSLLALVIRRTSQMAHN